MRPVTNGTTTHPRQKKPFAPSSTTTSPYLSATSRFPARRAPPLNGPVNRPSRHRAAADSSRRQTKAHSAIAGEVAAYLKDPPSFPIRAVFFVVVVFSPSSAPARQANRHTQTHNSDGGGENTSNCEPNAGPVEASPYLDIIVLAVFRHPRQVLVALHQGSLAGRDFLL